MHRFNALRLQLQRINPRESPLGFVRAPGRVNLIGEHTDYNGYPVLPMATDRDMRAVFKAREDDLVRIANTSQFFPGREFHLAEVRSNFPRGDWAQYVMAAFRGLLEEGYLSSPRGFDAVFDGNVPVAAGLSSSSALLVAAGLIFLACNGVSADRTALAATLARAERHAGIEGGGMDQAASLLAKKGEALRIDFYPLRAATLPLPGGCAVVICDSLRPAPKTASARDEYNLRVVECRLACALISRTLQKRTGAPYAAERIADLDAAFANMQSDERSGVIECALRGDELLLTEIASRLDATPDQVLRTYCTVRDGSVVRAPQQGFAVGRRYRHVVSEARRVADAQEALLCGDAASFGGLMRASHASCRDDYGVSCAELEELVALAGKAGALGARLTGAGFGGCTVNLVREEHLLLFMKTMKTGYYENKRCLMAERGIEICDALFACFAADAAEVWWSTGANDTLYA